MAYDSRDATKYLNMESPGGAWSHPESPNCDRSGERRTLSSPNVDAELARIMDTRIRHVYR